MTTTTCSWDGCDRPAEARGYCKRCYARARNAGILTTAREYIRQPKTCRIDGCEADSSGKGLCRAHYMRMWRHGDPNADVVYEHRDPICTVEGCTAGHKARGYCNDHYNAWKRHGDPLAEIQRRERNIGKVCSGPDCDRAAISSGLCGTHAMQRYEGNALTPIREYKPKGVPCAVSGCDGKSHTEGLCLTHYRRRLSQVPDWDAPIKRRAPRGSGHVDKHGYRIITVNGKTVREHRHIAEQLLGYKLPPGVDVHHWNTNRSDNSTDGPFRDDGTGTGNLRSGNLVVWLHKKGQPRGGEVGPVIAESRRRIAAGEDDEQDRMFVEKFGDLMDPEGPAGA